MKKAYFVDKNRLNFKVPVSGLLLMGVFIIALFIRLLYINQVVSTPVFYGLALDSEQYNAFAAQILKGNLLYKDSIYLNPFYPFFISLIYFLFKHALLPVLYIQGILDSISCIFIYYIALTLFNRRVGIIAALIYACYGLAIFYTGLLLPPAVIIFLSLLSVTLLLLAEKKGQVILFFISGILFCLVFLAGPHIFIFLLILPLWFLTALKNKLGISKSINGFLLLSAGFLMIVSLVAIKNYIIEKRFSPLPVHGGINFYIGNNPQADGYFMSPYGIPNSPVDHIKISVRYAEKESGKKLTPSRASRYWMLKGLRFIKDNPPDALFLYIKKFALFWRKEEFPSNINYSLSRTFIPILKLPFISFGAIAPFAILGIVLSIKKKKSNILLIALFTLSYMLSLIISFITARYRLPIVPFLIIFSSYTFYCLIEMLRLRKISNMIILCVILILLFALINVNFKYFTIDTPSLLSIHYNNLGNAYKYKGMLEESIAHYEKALSINPNYATAYNNLGVIYKDKSMLDDAISKYKKALAINPDYATAHANLGAAYIDKAMLSEAISECNEALAINPYDFKAHYNLGLAYYKKDMLNDAIFQYKEAIRINPNYSWAHSSLGLSYSKKGMLDEAISELKKAIATSPDLAAGYNNLAWIYATSQNEDIRNGDEALLLATKAHKLSGFKKAEVLATLAAAYAELGNYEKAIVYQKRALKLYHGKAKSALIKRLKLYQSGQAYRSKFEKYP